MGTQQLSVFLENKTGALAELLSLLARHSIDIVALTVADTSDYGLVRLIVSNPTKAQEALKKADFSVRIHSVISIEIGTSSGALLEVLNLFTKANIALEYVYAFSLGNKSIAVLRTNDKEQSLALIQQNHLRVITEEEYFSSR